VEALVSAIGWNRGFTLLHNLTDKPMSLRTIWGAHRIKVILAIIALAGSSYYAYGHYSAESTSTRYVLAAAETGTLVVSVSGTGQVSATNQVDLKPEIAGKIASVAMTNSQQVKEGQVLMQLDASDAYKAIRDAQTNLESAQLELEDLKAAPSELTLTQSQNSLYQAEESVTTAQKDLADSYTDGYSAVSNAFLALPNVMGGYDSLLFNKTLDRTQWNVDWYSSTSLVWNSNVTQEKKQVIAKYEAARDSYDTTFAYFKTLNRDSSSTALEQLVNDMYSTVRLIDTSIQATNNYLDYIQDLMEQNDYDIPTIMSQHQSTIDGYTSTVNQHLTAVTNARQSILNAREAITAAERTLKERQLSYQDLVDGPDALDLRNQELTVRQRQETLTEAQADLADYAVTAPFDGVITGLDENLKRGLSVSSGTTLATLITTKRMAEVTLNEIDVANVAVGQQATLTFDALEDITLTGKVAEVDTVGTVTQGVVSYTVKITFDVDDERIKPGMSVSATIATQVLTDVLMVPNSAIKTSGDSSYVEVLTGVTANQAATSTGVVSDQVPTRTTVEIGAANDTMTQIVSGLKSGDSVVVRTNTSSQEQSSTSSQSSTKSILSGEGGPGMGGGFIPR
jgi:RND family efflux transporter MFP subunit